MALALGGVVRGRAAGTPHSNAPGAVANLFWAEQLPAEKRAFGQLLRLELVGWEGFGTMRLARRFGCLLVGPAPV